MSSDRERRKERYAEDPEYRARVLAGNKVRRDRNKDVINEHRRVRRASDAEFRERCILSRRASHKRHKDESNARRRLRYATDPEFRAKARGQNLGHRYGITLQQYELLMKRQRGRCAICKKKPERGMLHVDHCHKTGWVRGLLCNGCNSGIGHLRDDIRLTKAATAYLGRKPLRGRGLPIFCKRRKNKKSRLAARTPVTVKSAKACPATSRKRIMKATTSPRPAPASGTAGGTRRGPPAPR
jgi:hypothetical protein